MFGSRSDDAVTCIACGATVPRSRAREYDKLGNRWDREDKSFEYFCKPCDGERDRQPRDGLESLLVSCGAGEHSQETFLQAYLEESLTASDSLRERE